MLEHDVLVFARDLDEKINAKDSVGRSTEASLFFWVILVQLAGMLLDCGHLAGKMTRQSARPRKCSLTSFSARCQVGDQPSVFGNGWQSSCIFQWLALDRSSTILLLKRVNHKKGGITKKKQPTYWWPFCCFCRYLSWMDWTGARVPQRDILYWGQQGTPGISFLRKMSGTFIWTSASKQLHAMEIMTTAKEETTRDVII